MAEKIEEKVSELERMMKNLAYAHMQTEMSLNALSEEMRAFKGEMLTFKEEMRAFKDEMLSFKNEMLSFKEEMRDDRKRMNKQWGELANKMGTVVEDIVAPNIPRIAKEYFNCENIEDFSVRRKLLNKKDNKTKREFDVIAKGDNLLIVNETKSTPRIEYIDDFANTLENIFDYFPQYRGLRVIPIFSSLYLDEDIVNYLSRNCKLPEQEKNICHGDEG